MTTQQGSAAAGRSAPTLADRSSNELAQARTDLAIQRTLMAADRTLMAWVRTAMSMGSFGFTLYKILQGFQQAGAALPSDSPRNIGLFLMGMGVAAMVLGIIEYRDTLKKLQQLEHLTLRRPALMMAAVIALAGVVLFVGVITRLL